MADDRSLVDVKVDHGVATLTLNDPARRNCVSKRMSLDVASACGRLDTDSAVRAVVLTGAGSVFSAGGDVEALADPDGDLTTVYAGFRAVYAMTKPVIGAINGPAIGAGLNFALGCDVLVAAGSARFDASFLDIAIHPGGGFLWRMNRAIGRQATAAMVLMGEQLDAREAADRGLVWRVVDDSDLVVTAHQLAARCAARDSDVVRRTKASLRASLPIQDERLAIGLEQAGQVWSMGRPAYREAAAALLARIRGGA